MNDTRTQILDVAEDLIQTVGVNAMSYKHISDSVGIRKASIHHHFPKKTDLIDALLERCRLTYGADYSQIVDGEGAAPEKLCKLAAVFEAGLAANKLCLVGSISTDSNTLAEGSVHILEQTIQHTVATFSTVFSQGREDNSLFFSGKEQDAAYAFFSFLVGVQIVARSSGGVPAFRRATETLITSYASREKNTVCHGDRPL